MNKLITTSTLGLAGLVATGLVAWQAPMAFGDDADDRPTHSGHIRARRSSATTTARCWSRPSTTTMTTTRGSTTRPGNTNTNTNTNTNGNTNTGTRTRGGESQQGGDHSRSGSVRDLTSDGPGSGNVDRSRHHTNDGTRHNTRGR